MNPKLRKLFAKTRLSVEDDLIVASVKSQNLSPSLLHKIQPFAVVFEGTNATLIVSSNNMHLLKALRAKVQGPFSLIKFDVKLPFGTIGFFAEITKVLASKKISILAISSFSKDYVLVPSGSEEKAVGSLQKLIKRR